MLLLTSWTLHNIIAWIKTKPFLGRRGNWLYIGSIALVQPYWILEIYANFTYFNTDNSRLFIRTRPYEALFRYVSPLHSLYSLLQLVNVPMSSDPWWIFTIVNLFWNIKFRYELGLLEIVKVSPRFGILLLCMSLSVIFIILDILAVTPVISIGVINPFWKFAFVFKCFTDSIILDDFKAALDKLSDYRRLRIRPFNVLGNTSSDWDSSNPREGKWTRRHGRAQDPRVPPDVENSPGRAGIELSDLSGLSIPARAQSNPIENRLS